MLFIFTVIQYLVSGVVAVWAAVLSIRNRPASPVLIISTGVVLALMLIQTIMGIVLWGTQDGTDPVLFFGYALTALCVLGLAGFWAFAELTRWGPIVLTIAALTNIIMLFRMDEIWM